MNNEVLLKQLVRQMKFMNFWITLFGTIGVIAIAVLAFFIFQLVTFIGETNTKLEGVKQEISQSTDIKRQVCTGDTTLSRFLISSGACK